MTKIKKNTYHPDCKCSARPFLYSLFFIPMRKKNFVGVFALALLATAGFGVNKSMKSNANLNDLALSNVEALASGES